MKRFVSVVFTVVLLSGLAACGPAATPTEAPPPAATPTPAPATPTPAAPAAATRPLVFAANTEAITLDPHVNDFGYSQWPQRAGYESLIHYELTPEGDLRIIPMLATSWEVSEDAKLVTLHLQEGVEFSDGTPFNAEAVKYNFERIFGIGEQPSGRLPKIASIEVIDDLTIRINLESPFAPIVDALAKPLMVSPAAAKEHEVDGDWGKAWLDEHMVGTGPFLLEEWLRGQQVSFTKNPDYWRGWEGNHPEEIIIKIVKEPTTRRMMLETGDADLAWAIPFDDLDAISRVPGVVCDEEPAATLYTFKFRLRGPLTEVGVRKAIQYAFDYEAFVQGVLNGRGQIASGPLPTVVWAADPSLPEFTRDMEKAEELLAEAGYPEGGFSLEIGIIPMFGWFQPMAAQILQQNLAELGIDLKISEFADAATFVGVLTELETGPDMYAWTFSNSYNDPEDNFRRDFRTGLQFGKGGTNAIFYSNPRVDELIDEGITLGDREARRPLYVEIQKILLEDAPAIWMAEPRFYVCHQEALRAFPYHAFSDNNGWDWWPIWLSE